MKQRGFTLIELVVIIVIVGVLAVVALPRIFQRQSFDTLGFYDETRAIVRYAQKVAVAQRRPVFVRLTTNSVAACFDAGCASPVSDPARGGALQAAAPSGVGVAPATTFSFDGLGRPSFGASLTVSVSGDGSRSFLVEAETGYVR